MKKFEIDYVKKIFVDNGCELLEKHYIDCEYAMSYKCHCGNISKISLSNFKKGKRCMLCAVNKRANARKHSYEYVSNFFRDNGCTLISKNYFRNDDFLDYCNSMGYVIDKDALDFKFSQIIERIKNILKIN